MEFNINLIKYGFNSYLHAKVWRHIGYSDLVKEYGSKYGFCDGNNIVGWGHPKGDYVLEKVEIPPEWISKTKQRKVVLWTPHHTIDSSDPEHVGTWNQWSSLILKYFESDQDVVLILRPHPFLFSRLISNKLATYKEIEDFKEELKKRDNVILDETTDYRISFQISDAIITDGSTFSLEYMYMNKPEAITTDNPQVFYKTEELQKSAYFLNSENDLIKFINDTKNGKDEYSDSRKEFINKYLISPKTKTIGLNIIERIVDEINQSTILSSNNT